MSYGYSCTDWDSLYDHLRDGPWKDVFKLVTSAAVMEFYEWVQVGIDIYIHIYIYIYNIYIYIPNHKYQVKPHLCLWFFAACAVAIGHRYHFYCFYHYNR